MTRSPISHLAKTLRQNQTRYERQLWKSLRLFKHDGFHFRRQALIGNYIVDFVCHSAKLVVELDGGHHSGQAQNTIDFKRDNWLEDQGLRVLRFTNSEVYEDTDGVCRYIEAVLQDPSIDTPPQTPPHQGEG